MDLQTLTTKHNAVVKLAAAVRSAQKAYYAYRVRSELDAPRKARLLSESKRLEHQLDTLLAQEIKDMNTPQLF